MIQTIEDLTAALGSEVSAFEGSQYPLPLCEAVLGCIPTMADVRARLEAADPDNVSGLALSVAMAAECYEASQPDAPELFVTDAKLRGLVFSGGKWRAGWAFLLGEGGSELASQLDAREFIVLEAEGRTTRPVYWLQMMVRYAMTWGQIPPGDDHEMGHFLEDDLPGVLIVRRDRCEIESLLALAMMALGCPAVVAPDFPFEEGRQARIEDDGEVLDAIAALPNLRVKEVAGQRISLPSYCDPAYAKEPFEAARTVGGDDRSFFVLRPGDGGDGAEVVGEPDGSVGVLIEVGDARLDVEASQYLEKVALGIPDYLPGVRVVSADPFTLGLSSTAALAADQLAGVLQEGLRWNFPKLGAIRVRVIFDREQLDLLAPEAVAFQRERQEQLAGRSESNVDHFVACIECQPFSHSHVCVVTPDRVPMCGRSPGQVKAAALFGATWHPYRRRGLKAPELRELVPKGRCIDAERGEYEGVNDAARRLSDGAIQRVFLHSLDDCPHSSCGCFHHLAFRIEGRGTGVMHRGFEGAAPNGETWDLLANRAGGKQADGVTGLSTGYLRSPLFLKGDGCLEGVVWTTTKVLEEIRDLLPSDRLPATEQDAETMEDLDRYLGQRSQSAQG